MQKRSCKIERGFRVLLPHPLQRADDSVSDRVALFSECDFKDPGNVIGLRSASFPCSAYLAGDINSGLPHFFVIAPEQIFQEI